MKRLLSGVLSVCLLSGLQSPLALADEDRERILQLRSAQRQILRELRKERDQPSKLSQLREELEAIKDAMRELRRERVAERRAERKRKLSIRRLQLAEDTTTTPESGTVVQTEVGQASYYADKFNGRTTASGAVFSNQLMTAAHKTLPFGTRVRVTNPSNGKVVEVVINDRGPFVAGRVIDLSSAAFTQLESLSRGVIDVTVEVLADQ